VITTSELRRIATRSGARQIRNVEIDIILTLLLQLFHERGVLDTELESKLANDKTGKAQAEADQLTEELRPTPRVR